MDRTPPVVPRPAIQRRALLAYLVGAGVASATILDDPDVRISDLSRSHLVLSVRLGTDAHVIVKRARARPGEVSGNLHRELCAYRLAAGHERLAAAMPALRWADLARQVLVIDAVEPGVTLFDDAHARGRPSPVLARRLGQLAAGWHRSTRDLPTAATGIAGARPRPGMLPAEEPWVLGILTPGRWRPAVSDHLLVHGPIRRELRAHFAELREALEPSCVVHGDLKWDNCLVDAADGVRVIDWEQAAVGDPAWDVAGILQEHVAFLRSAAPHDRWEEPFPERQIPGAVDGWPAGFLAAYLDAAAPRARARFTERATRLAGARLVQTALEHAAVSADQRLARRLLADALAILRDPHLLLPPGTGAG